MATFNTGDMVTIESLGIIGKVTGETSEGYQVEYYGASYEIVNQTFEATDLTLAPSDSAIGQLELVP